ncbi:MAG: haloacid dehalogenase [Acidimicrobiia bacterium]|nr:haloacid dehalogenase [Acidimicrobiia bacterium]
MVAECCADLEGVNSAREVTLVACRSAIRAAGSSIRAVHRQDAVEALRLADECEVAVRHALDAAGPYPQLRAGGFLHDAQKEFAEARLTAALVSGGQLPSAAALGVDTAAWLRGLAEAASELRRHLLDRLREGQLDRAEHLLEAMDEVYGALVVVDYPDAVTNGLRRTLDSLRAVLERTRGDVTTTVLQHRLQRAIEAASPTTGTT